MRIHDLSGRRKIRRSQPERNWRKEAGDAENALHEARLRIGVVICALDSALEGNTHDYSLQDIAWGVYFLLRDVDKDIGRQLNVPLETEEREGGGDDA